MFNFEKSVQVRADEGFRSSSGMSRVGNSWEEIEEYLEKQVEVAP